MAKLKTRPNNRSPSSYIKSIEDDARRRDCIAVMAMMKKITGKQPKMWGTSIVGYGQYHYKYKSGREGDWFVTGIAARKHNLSLHIMPGFSNYAAIMNKLGKYKLGVSCLYIKSLADVDEILLYELIDKSVIDMRTMYECT